MSLISPRGGAKWKLLPLFSQSYRSCYSTLLTASCSPFGILSSPWERFWHHPCCLAIFSHKSYSSMRAKHTWTQIYPWEYISEVLTYFQFTMKSGKVRILYQLIQSIGQQTLFDQHQNSENRSKAKHNLATRNDFQKIHLPSSPSKFHLSVNWMVASQHNTRKWSHFC